MELEYQYYDLDILVAIFNYDSSEVIAKNIFKILLGLHPGLTPVSGVLTKT